MAEKQERNGGLPVADRAANFFVAMEDALRRLAAGAEGLDLDGECSTPEDVRRLADALKVNASLTTLYLYNNNFGDEGAASLADALKVNASLTVLNLYENNIGAEGAASLADALKVNASLTELHLDYNDIGAAGAASIAESLKVNTSLTKLCRAVLYNDAV